MTNIASPYRFDARGRTATTDDESHVRDLIEHVLMTAAGERVNRPDFGCGAPQLVFSPASPAIAATVQLLVRSALQQWLASEIIVEDLKVSAEDGALLVTVVYLNRRTQALRTASFSPASPALLSR